jgi:phospholipid transport system substrate-binding protein
MFRFRVLAVCAVLLVVVVARDAGAGPPTDQLRLNIDQVLKVLQDPVLKAEAKTAERRGAIRGIANEIFDFNEISQRSLGRHWQARTPAEREEFVRLFTDILERSYVTKIEGFSGEKIAYVGEQLDGDTATVKTKIVTKQGTEIPLDYRMLANAGHWRAYDVNIEGISLVGNYRGQFNAVVQKASFQELLVKLRAKRQEPPDERRAARALAPGELSPPDIRPRQSP